MIVATIMVNKITVTMISVTVINDTILLVAMTFVARTIFSIPLATMSMITLLIVTVLSVTLNNDGSQPCFLQTCCSHPPVLVWSYMESTTGDPGGNVQELCKILVTEITVTIAISTPMSSTTKSGKWMIATTITHPGLKSKDLTSFAGSNFGWLYLGLIVVHRTFSAWPAN